jgi:hypothetical protein
MANYNEIIALHLTGNAIGTIITKLKLPPSQVRFAIGEFNRAFKETEEDRIEQAKSMENEVFRRIEEEKQAGFYDKKLNSYITLFSQFNALK